MSAAIWPNLVHQHNIVPLEHLNTAKTPCGGDGGIAWRIATRIDALDHSRGYLHEASRFMGQQHSVEGRQARHTQTKLAATIASGVEWLTTLAHFVRSGKQNLTSPNAQMQTQWIF
jgi:hypothetical protein